MQSIWQPRSGKRRNIRWFALQSGLLAAVLLLLASCSREPAPNVLLVTFDTTRYDHLGCTGDPFAETPVVDALAERGILFKRAYANVGLTLPAHTAILTGLHPASHGVHNNGRFQVPDDVTTLAEMLGDQNYTTAAFVSAFVLDPRYNLNQGFDIYNADTKGSSDPLDMTVPQRSGAETTDIALEWLKERDAKKPFFLWVHYYDPHLPRDVEPPFDKIPDAYRAEISYTDAQFGRLLEGVDQSSPKRETFIVMTSDHGESFGQHGETTHGLVAYDSTLHVPLILSGPGVPEGIRTNAFARHVDLVPTILSALHLPVPENLGGRDLLQVASSENSSADQEDEALGYFESMGPKVDLGWAGIAGVRTARWKYTATPSPVELYDIPADPDETQNLADAQPEVVRELAARFEHLEQTETRPETGAEQMELSLEEAAQLAALGYVEAAPLVSGETPPDPRRFVAAHGWVGNGRSMAMRGRYDEAIELLETLSASHSVRALVLRTLAPVYAQAGRYEDAIGAYRQYIELTGALEARLGLASTLIKVGRGEEALAELDAITPRTSKVSVRRAQVFYHLGRYEEGRQALDIAYPGDSSQQTRRRTQATLVLEVAPMEGGLAELRSLHEQAPEDAMLMSTLGFYLSVWGEPDQEEEALSLLRTARETEPENASILSDLGWALHKAGLDEEAKTVLEKALEIDHSRQNDRARLAKVLFNLGESKEALRLLRIALRDRPAASWADVAKALAAEIEATLAESAIEDPNS